MRLNEKGSGGASGALPFDLRALEIFAAVAATRNMTAAAAQLNVTQPAVSQVFANWSASSACNWSCVGRGRWR